MKNIVIVLLVVALLVLAVGAVNQDQVVDLDYVFGTWEDVSLLSLSGIVAGLTLLLGVLIGAIARVGATGDRRKLQTELQQVYERLRAAEAGSSLASPVDTAQEEAATEPEPPATQTAPGGSISSE